MNSVILEEEAGFYYEDSDGDWVGPFSTWAQADTAYKAAIKWSCEDRQRERKFKEKDEH